MKFLVFAFTFVFLLQAAFSEDAFLRMVCKKNFCEGKSCLGSPQAQSDCERIRGNDVHEYKLVEHGSFCGCCHSCVKQLNKGDRCMTLFGIPSHSRCAKGLVCSKDHVCVEEKIVTESHN